jgi:hypothetical protein
MKNTNTNTPAVVMTTKTVTYRKDGEDHTGVNTFTVKQTAPGTYIETETGEDGFTRDRDVKVAPVCVLTTANLSIRATPVRPVARPKYHSWGDVEYRWQYAVSATVGGKDVALTTDDLARLAKLAAALGCEPENVTAF